jgi:hypothetical protein
MPASEAALATLVARLPSTDPSIQLSGLRKLLELVAPVRTRDARVRELCACGGVEALAPLLLLLPSTPTPSSRLAAEGAAGDGGSSGGGDSDGPATAAGLALELVSLVAHNADAARRIAALPATCEILVHTVGSSGGDDNGGVRQGLAARVLAEVARDADGQAILAARGVIPSLVASLQRPAAALGTGLAAGGGWEGVLRLEVVRALRHLSEDGNNRIKIVAAGGHEPLLELIRHGGSGGLEQGGAAEDERQVAASVVANLALYRHNKRKLREAGAVPCLVDALSLGEPAPMDADQGSRRPSTPGLRRAAVTALSRLTKNDAENQAALIEAGGARALVAWLQDDVARAAEEEGGGGEAYGPGVRELARQTLAAAHADVAAESAALRAAAAAEASEGALRAERLRAQADDALVAGELDRAAAGFQRAAALQPHSQLLQARLRRTEVGDFSPARPPVTTVMIGVGMGHSYWCVRRRWGADHGAHRSACVRACVRGQRERISVDAVCHRISRLRAARRRRGAAAVDPTTLAPGGTVGAVALLRTVAARGAWPVGGGGGGGGGDGALAAVCAAREQLDGAAAALQQLQGALHKRAEEFTAAVDHRGESGASVSSSAVFSSTAAAAVAEAGVVGGAAEAAEARLPSAVAQLVAERDMARRRYLESAELFLRVLQSGAELGARHDAAAHVVGPLRQAAAQLQQHLPAAAAAVRRPLCPFWRPF